MRPDGREARVLGMGTVYYTLDGRKIGKRSFVGVWCWRCRVRACRMRADGRAASYAEEDAFADAFFTSLLRGDEEHGMLPIPPWRMSPLWECPHCRLTGRPPDRRLFPELAHEGIDRACAWHWHLSDWDGLGTTVADVRRALGRRRTVKDEYGARFSLPAFWQEFVDVIVERS